MFLMIKGAIHINRHHKPLDPLTTTTTKKQRFIKQIQEKHKKKEQKYIIVVRHIGEGTGTLLQYSGLENPMDGGAWWAAVHGVDKSLTWLSDFTLTFHFHALEKEMATHFSVLAWGIPGTGEPGGLLSMGSHRVRHDWSDLSVVAAMRHINISLRIFYQL